MIDQSANPETLANQALETYNAGDYSHAAKVFFEARALFLASDLPVRAAEMSNNLCVCLLQIDRAQDALNEVEDSPATFHASGNALLQAQALGNRAMAKAALGLISGAESDYQAAAQIFRDLDHQEGLQYSMQALSRLQLQQGQPMEALDSIQSVLSGKTKPSLRDRFLNWLFKLPLRLFRR